MPPFSLSTVQRSFEPEIIERGRNYLENGNVLEVELETPDLIVGEVAGTARRPYVVKLAIVQKSSATYLRSSCTCPYESQCKHAAAVALAFIEFEVDQVDQKEQEGINSPSGINSSQVSGASLDRLLSQPTPPVSLEVPLPHELSEWLNRLSASGANKGVVLPDSKAIVFYVISGKQLPNGSVAPVVTVVTRSTLKSGGYGVDQEVKATSIASGNLPKFFTPLDLELVPDLDRNAVKTDWKRAEYRLDGTHGARLLSTILSTGRCTWGTSSDPFLKLGLERKGTLDWKEVGKDGTIHATVDFGEPGAVLSVTPPWYIATGSLTCGPLDCGMAPDRAALLLRSAPIRPEHVSTVRNRLSAIGISKSLLPETKRNTVVRAPDVVPVLNIQFEICHRSSYFGSSAVSAPIPFADLTFEYDGHQTVARNPEIRIVKSDEIVVIKRNEAAEQKALGILNSLGFQETGYTGWQIPTTRSEQLCIVPADNSTLHEPIVLVNQMVEDSFPKLIEAGWRVDVEQAYRFVPDDEVEWDLGLDGSSGIDWFEVQVGIKAEGQALDLRTILRNLFVEQSQGGGRHGAGGRYSQSDDMFVFDNDGRAIRLSRKRLNAILQPLLEMFGGVQDWPSDLRLPKALISETSQFEDTIIEEGLPWHTNAELKRLADRLGTFDHLEPLPEPTGFLGELRGYQKEGLAWLQFLREYEFSGILADDMGLGKTVQLLAFLQMEKKAGRLDRPSLIVAPTSTLPNWRRECERFTPDLKVVSLQGAGRFGRFGELTEADIALTTYPLLARDKEQLMTTDYHVVALDEAQNIKNPVTIGARAARELVARHRICMSGTPVENHLGELWSLFQFLMPGFLGTDTEFRRQFRVPIEKSGDKAAQERLIRRIKPFVLRRTKGEVVKELPPKTEIIESVEFGEAQRDLYESIRVAMDDQVRQLIAAQGFDRSRIQILDALLKLRQVCCDPRLVKLPAAKSVLESAKLDRLIEMVTVLLEDGRKILLFSQFTSMLNLIEGRLKEVGVKWVRISGDTIDRETPVLQFQAGEVPLFLISLKAGGTGLNLTAADTVILYDPWWNPAVENQAIDRAHRIGQDKAVMVYKLVASGTIEEKMLEMQARKGDLAKSILTDDAEGIRSLTAEDLKWVLS